jgi:hypothetical protein
MSRPVIPLASLVLWLGTVTAANGQAARPPYLVLRREPEDRFAQRDLARARYAASRADARTTALARRDAAFEAVEARVREFLAGRGTLDFMLAAARQMRNSGMALSTTPADRLLVREVYWTLLYHAERVNRARYEANRIPIQDHMQTRYYRLEAEGDLLEARARLDKSGTVLLAQHGVLPDTDDGTLTKYLARAKFAASRAQRETLLRARIEAAQEQLEARFREFLAGRGTLDFILESHGNLYQALRALYPDPAEQLPFFEANWLQAWEAERINQARFDAARIPIQDIAGSRHERLKAALALLDARAKLPADGPRFVRPWFPLDGGEEDPKAGQRIARWKWELNGSDKQQLRRDVHEAILEQTEARWREFLAGRGTLTFLLESARKLLDAEWALATTRAEQRVVVERHWDKMHEIWRVNSARYDKGRIPIQDVAQTRYYLEQATGWLLEAQGNAGK